MIMEDYELVRRDFNEIAGLPEQPKWNHNNCYFDSLLGFLPPRAGLCLDVGCGQGELSALLSPRAEQVLGVDIAEKMIDCARLKNARPNVEYICGNILDMDFEDGSLDAVVSTATAHHLPFGWLSGFAEKKLKEGGVLAVLDLVRAETLPEKIFWGFAAVPNVFMNIVKNGRLRKDDARSTEVWRRHGEHDEYLTFSEVKRLAARLPGAVVKRRLFWRYMLIWQK